MSKHDLTRQDHDHSRCVTDALAQAEAVCAEQGLRLTALRKRVLELVWDSHKPVGAYDILEALSTEAKRAAPPTVYRALDFLMEAGLVHRLDSLNAFIGCQDPGHSHTGQFLICRNCRRVIELDSREATQRIDKTISDAAADVGFAAEQQMLEVQGLCRDCRDSA